MALPDDRSAVLVIRAWHEPGSPPHDVRARLTQTRDTDVTGWDESVARGEAEIVAAVLRWLEDFNGR
jgi:hypothetical protein